MFLVVFWIECVDVVAVAFACTYGQCFLFLGPKMTFLTLWLPLNFFSSVINFQELFQLLGDFSVISFLIPVGQSCWCRDIITYFFMSSFLSSWVPFLYLLCWNWLLRTLECVSSFPLPVTSSCILSAKVVLGLHLFTAKYLISKSMAYFSWFPEHFLKLFVEDHCSISGTGFGLLDLPLGIA